MTLSYIIGMILYILPCFLLLFFTFRDRLRVPYVPRISVSVFLYSAITFLGSYIFLFEISTLRHTLLSFIIMIAGTCLFCNSVTYNFWQGFFIIAIVNCYAENIYLLSLYIQFAVKSVFTLPACPRFLYTTLPLTLLSFPFAYMFCRKLLRQAVDYTISLNIWRIMWIIPMCNTAIYNLTVSPHLGSPFFTPGNAFFFVPPLWVLLTFTTYTIILQMITNISKNAVLQETLHLSETQINAQRKQLETLQSHMEQLQRFRHDTRHHILVIDNFLKTQNNDGLKDYLSELTESLPAAPENYCGNPVINALLCYYREMAENEHIQVNFSVSLSESLPFSDTDLCIILGNFLENAVEACMRMTSTDKFITLKMSMPGRLTLVILTENSYEGIIRRTTDGAFLSSKEKNRKGIGIASIINIIKKYNGIPRFEYNEPIFRASLLLNAKEQPQ